MYKTDKPDQILRQTKIGERPEAITEVKILPFIKHR